MKVIITGGGTGGHVYPAISIADKIKKKYPKAEILFIGTENGLENDVVPKAGYAFKTITVRGFRRKLTLDTVKTVSDMFKGFFQAGKLIKHFKPDIIVGTGGYVAGPVLIQGAIKGIKTIVHEQNVIPGVTVKILSKYVNKVLISYDESKDYFKKKSNLVVTGNPIRNEFLTLSKEKCREAINIAEGQKFLFSVGGSGGAKRINDVANELIRKYNGDEKIRFVHVTGKSYYDTFMQELEKDSIILSSNISVLKYVYNIPEYMKAADMMISRSGALILSEIAVVGVPSILIPSPNVAHNHQEHNAKVFEKNGAAIMITEKKLKEDTVYKIIEEHIYQDDHLEKMSDNSIKLSLPKASETILKEIEKLIK